MADLDIAAERVLFEAWHNKTFRWISARCVIISFNYADQRTQERWETWQAARAAPTLPKVEAAPDDAKKLAYGHRDDYYLMSNARALAREPIAEIRRMPNWVLAKRLFATGSTSAHQICIDAGIDPDGYMVERAARLQARQDGGGE